MWGLLEGGGGSERGCSLFEWRIMVSIQRDSTSLGSECCLVKLPAFWPNNAGSESAFSIGQNVARICTETTGKITIYLLACYFIILNCDTQQVHSYWAKCSLHTGVKINSTNYKGNVIVLFQGTLLEFISYFHLGQCSSLQDVFQKHSTVIMNFNDHDNFTTAPHN